MAEVATLLSPEHLGGYLLVGALLFAVGVACCVIRRNAVGFLMGLELMLNGGALTFVAFARFRPEGGMVDGQVMALFIIALAAAEAAVALALLFAIWRGFRDVDLERTRELGER